MTKKPAYLAFSLLLVFSGCGDDGGSDGGRDSGGTDSGPPRDGGNDAGGDGGGPTDAGGDTAPPDCPAMTVPALALTEIASGFRNPVQVEQPPGSTDLYIVEKRGLILIFRPGMGVLKTPFLDIRSIIGSEPMGNDERGLLGLAFHPDYAANGRFFLGYTPTRAAQNVVAEFARDGSDPDRASGMVVQTLVDIPDPAPNHNGGFVVFGPDNRLYAGMGDGGGGCDSERPGTSDGNGQALDTLLGKILRLDVDNAGGDFVAAGNPFEAGGGEPQIWHYGVRNPWRFSFDRMTGDLFIGDVGQDAVEEVSVGPAGVGGLNFGWKVYEGNELASDTVSGCAPEDLNGTHTPPVLDFAQGSMTEDVRGACSATGGYVYRGSAIPALVGWYLYTDFCSGDVGAFRYCGGMATSPQRTSLDVGFATSSFGEDNQGELYVVIHDDADGAVLQIVAE